MSKSLILLWVVMLILEIIVITLVINPETVKKNRKEEIRLISKWFGIEKTKEIYLESKLEFKKNIVENGIKNTVEKLLIPSKSVKITNKGINNIGDADFWVFVRNRVDSFFLVIETIILRGKVILFCFIHWLVFLIPALVDGLMKREIEKHSEANASINVYTLSRNVFYSCLIFPLIILIWPTAVDPFFIGFWATLLAISSWFMSANVQHRI